MRFIKPKSLDPLINFIAIQYDFNIQIDNLEKDL